MSRFLTVEEICGRYRLVTADGRLNVMAVPDGSKLVRPLAQNTGENNGAERSGWPPENRGESGASFDRNEPA